MLLYHKVPERLVGTNLYPLNVLRTACPHLYAEYVQKYAGREHLLTEKIPPLDCIWNDVVFLTPVPPSELRRGFIEAGIVRPLLRFFAIEAEALDPALTTIMAYERNEERKFERKFLPYEPSVLPAHTTLPVETISYYREQKSLGKRPLVFHLVTHVLHKGPIEVEGTCIVEA